jgi:hypothetical protein
LVEQRLNQRFLEAACKALSKPSHEERRFPQTASKSDLKLKNEERRVQITKVEQVSREVREYRENHLLPIADAWRVHRRLYNEQSRNLLIWDLETSWGSSPEHGFPLIFQICVWNGAKEEIVYATINQKMSVNALYRLSDAPSWKGQVRRWYGPPSEEETWGKLTIDEVVTLFENEGINENTYAIEQSINFFDRDILFNNFQAMGKGYLIPKREHVFRLPKAWRLAFWNFKISHGLSSMHRMLHPEQKSLIQNAHDSRCDVEMTYTQARDYFKGTENRLKPSGIEHYFIKSGLNENKNNWTDYYCTKDDTGDLLLPVEFEIIKNLNVDADV